MKTILRSPAFTVALFALAVVLLGFGTVGAVQAAPTFTTDDYIGQMKLSRIKTSLVEITPDNGGFKRTELKDGDTLLTELLSSNGGDKELKIGKAYKTQLAVKNTGTINEYVRVTLRAYWTNERGTKVLDVDPSLIKLHFVEGSGWTKDDAASKGERTVLYYGSEIKPGQETNSIFDSVTIDGAVATAVTDRNYDYNDLQFHVKAEADAVQTHNGDKAMKSAWGRTNK